jgi:hypothetical protein
VEYVIPFFVFLIVVAGGLMVLVIVSRLTAEPDGDETPLGDTDQHSDAIDEPRRAA